MWERNITVNNPLLALYPVPSVDHVYTAHMIPTTSYWYQTNIKDLWRLFIRRMDRFAGLLAPGIDSPAITFRFNMGKSAKERGWAVI